MKSHRSIFPLFWFLIFTIHSPPVVADNVYVCQDQTGRKMYSSEPCSGNQKLLKQETTIPLETTDDVVPQNIYAGELDRVIKDRLKDGKIDRARALATTDEHWEWINQAEDKIRQETPVILREQVVVPVYENQDNGSSYIDDGLWWGGYPGYYYRPGRDGHRHNPNYRYGNNYIYQEKLNNIRDNSYRYSPYDDNPYHFNPYPNARPSGDSSRDRTVDRRPAAQPAVKPPQTKSTTSQRSGSIR